MPRGGGSQSATEILLVARDADGYEAVTTHMYIHPRIGLIAIYCCDPNEVAGRFEC